MAGNCPSGRLLGDSAREEEWHRLLPQATAKAGASTLRSVKGGRKSLAVVSTQTGKSPLAASYTNTEVASSTSESSATFITSQDLPTVSNASSQEHVAEPFGGRESPYDHSSSVAHVARQVAIGRSHSETPMDKRVSFRRSEEREILQRRSPWRDRSLNVRQVFPVDGTFKLWRKVSGIFFFF